MDNNQNLIIDNVGFPVEEMKSLTEEEFVNLFKDNESISREYPQKRVQWLKDAYKAIQSHPALPEKPAGGTGKGKTTKPPVE